MPRLILLAHHFNTRRHVLVHLRRDHADRLRPARDRAGGLANRHSAAANDDDESIAQIQPKGIRAAHGTTPNPSESSQTCHSEACFSLYRPEKCPRSSPSDTRHEPSTSSSKSSAPTASPPLPTSASSHAAGDTRISTMTHSSMSCPRTG